MKKLISVLLLLCLIFSSISVFAHPGKTDGRGGHYNRSTGEYHYHHGYSAHQHKDINSDGVLDCPYDFVDKTDNSNKDSYSSKSESSNHLVSQPQKNKIITFISENSSVIYIAIWIFIPWIITYFLYKE